MWVSAFVFRLFSAGRVRGFSVGCIIVGWVEGPRFPLLCSIEDSCSFSGVMLLVTVSLSVFTQMESSLVREGDGGNGWLVFVFLLSLLLGFFSFCCCCY